MFDLMRLWRVSAIHIEHFFVHRLCEREMDESRRCDFTFTHVYIMCYVCVCHIHRSIRRLVIKTQQHCKRGMERTFKVRCCYGSSGCDKARSAVQKMYACIQ